MNNTLIPTNMCHKVKLVWQCGHSYIEDPRRCRMAFSRNKKSCQGYAFSWAFRDPVIEELQNDCRKCQHARAEDAIRKANMNFVEKSKAYPHLRDVSAHDDEKRRKTGRPRYDRTNSCACEISIPDGWTPAHSRLPNNANEYEQFVRGRFNPLQQLPDSHVPPQVQGHILYGGPRPLPFPTMSATDKPRARYQPDPHAFTTQTRTTSQGYRSRPPPLNFAPQIPNDPRIVDFVIARHAHAQITPPPAELAEAILEEAEYPFVEFRELGCGPPRRASDRRRPSVTRCDRAKGWVPPINSPLPPAQQTDTAPPSWSESGANGMSRSLP